MNKNRLLEGIIKYVVILVCFLSLNSVIDGVFFAYSLYVGLLYAGFSPIVLSISYLASFLVFKSYQMLLFGLIQAVLFCGLFLLYKIKNQTPKLEIILYFLASVLPYVLFSDNLIQKIVYATVICLFSFISIQAVSILITVKNRAKPEIFPTLCFSLIFVLTAVGFINIFGVNAFKSFSVLTVLFSQICFEKYTPYLISGILASPLAITQIAPEYFCVLFLWLLLSVIFSDKSRFFASTGIIFAEFLSAYLFDIYPFYQPTDFLFVAVPAIIFAFLPPFIFKNIKEFLNLNPKELLYYNYLNRTRTNLSQKLYEISGVFFQMKSAITDLKSSSLTRSEITQKITEETILNVCAGCTFYERCQMKNQPNPDVFNSFILIGLSKNRLTLFDLPRSFTEVCGYPNSIIFEVNRLIGEHLDLIKQSEDVLHSKQIVSTQANSLGEILKNLAFDFSKTFSPDKGAEKTLVDGLKRRGFFISGALILGESENAEIHIFTNEKTFKNPRFLEALSTITGEKLSFFSVTPFNDDLILVGAKKSPPLDAVFGISSSPKTGSKYSGDTHSLIKINEGKFLIGLSDGMGSGEIARNTSTATLNLIESFYRAGLSHDLILDSVNSILTLSSTENFSAVDLAVCDLYDGKCDFIKIGAPYGFIVNDNGVRFIEGASLPIGILDELRPSFLELPVSSGDVLVLMSDGITDAFGSSVEITEFLSRTKLKNPQNLADSIVETAINLSGGKKCDDLSCVCVRLIEKIAV